MSDVTSILPTLISGANDIVTQMKADPRTDQTVTRLLGKASGAIQSIRKMGVKDSVGKAADILHSLPIDASHPLAQHADVAKCGLQFAQKYLDFVGQKKT